MTRSQAVVGVVALALEFLALRGVGPAARDGDDDLTRQLRTLDATVLDGAGDPAKQLARHAQARLREAHRRESRAWQAIRTPAGWEQYRRVRLDALRAS